MALLKSNIFLDAIMDNNMFFMKMSIATKVWTHCCSFLFRFVLSCIYLYIYIYIYIYISISGHPLPGFGFIWPLSYKKIHWIYYIFLSFFIFTYPKHVSWDWHKKILRNMTCLWKKTLKTSKSISTHPGLRYPAREKTAKDDRRYQQNISFTCPLFLNVFITKIYLQLLSLPW